MLTPPHNFQFVKDLLFGGVLILSRACSSIICLSYVVRYSIDWMTERFNVTSESCAHSAWAVMKYLRSYDSMNSLVGFKVKVLQLFSCSRVVVSKQLLVATKPQSSAPSSRSCRQSLATRSPLLLAADFGGRSSVSKGEIFKTVAKTVGY